jgi:hypothetical protein
MIDFTLTLESDSDRESRFGEGELWSVIMNEIERCGCALMKASNGGSFELVDVVVVLSASLTGIGTRSSIKVKRRGSFGSSFRLLVLILFCDGESSFDDSQSSR